MIELIKEWAKYKKFLQKKYPVQKGEKWEFTCEHHKKIDKLVNLMKLQNQNFLK